MRSSPVVRAVEAAAILAVLAPHLVAAQSVQGAPSGVTAVPVTRQAIEGAPHPGVPSSIINREAAGATSIDVLSPTYNDGMWTPTSGADGQYTGWSSAVSGSESAVTAAPTETEQSQSTVEPQVTSAIQTETQTTELLLTFSAEETSSQAPPTTQTVPTTPPPVSLTPESTTSLIPTTSSVIPTTTSSESSSSPTTSSTELSSSSSAISSSSSTTNSAFANKDNLDSNNVPKINAAVPVGVTLAVLAILLGVFLFFIWRRKSNRQRILNSRRWGPDESEKTPRRYGFGSEYDSIEEKEAGGQWTSFGRNSGYDDADAGMAGVGVGRGYGSHEEQDGNERGWHWGVHPKGPRGPLPITPLHENNAMMQEALVQDIDNMLAESRTGYQPSSARKLQKQNTLTRTASAIYTSLAGKSQRFNSKASSRSAYSNENGTYNEHGVWQVDPDAVEYNPHQHIRSKEVMADKIAHDEEGQQQRRLLDCVDETPRKKGYSTYTPSDTPHAYSDSDIGVAGSLPMQNTSSETSAHTRYTLTDGPVPAPTSPSTPKRWRSKTNQNIHEVDSPSIYSPSVVHGQFTPIPPPASLMPGKSPAVGNKAASPAIQSHPAWRAFNKPNPAAPAVVTQAAKNGPTYSLGGMAGVLYSEDAKTQPQQQRQNLTEMPASKPRRKSVHSRPQTAAAPRNEHNNPAYQQQAEDPHRAVSRVVRMSRDRGSSMDGGRPPSSPGTSSSGRASTAGAWSAQVQKQLRERSDSTGSINELLNHVLAPSRPPA